MASLHYEDMQDLGINRENALRMHLSGNFYPPLPSFVKDIFINAFTKYWAYESDIDGLTEDLKEVYRGSLYSYGFEHYLNPEDLEGDY